jgi:hypothetical protein
MDNMLAAVHTLGMGSSPYNDILEVIFNDKGVVTDFRTRENVKTSSSGPFGL